MSIDNTRYLDVPDNLDTNINNTIDELRIELRDILPSVVDAILEDESLTLEEDYIIDQVHHHLEETLDDEYFEFYKLYANTTIDIDENERCLDIKISF